MLFRVLKRILMLFLIPLWIPIVIVYFIYLWLIKLPSDFIVYHMSHLKQYGSFRTFQKSDARLDFLIFSKIRKYHPEHILDIEEGLINCFWVRNGRNYAFISEGSIGMKTGYGKITFIYQNYFQTQFGVTLDGVFIVTGSKRNSPDANIGIITTGEITKVISRGKL